MHKLDRSTVPDPECLGLWDYQTQKWEDFTTQGAVCKRTVRLSLQRIQGQQIDTDEADDEAESILGLRCAYCESQIFFGGHIEHFRRKNQNHYPELTFVWENFFLSCGSKDHCGHYKDRPSADPYDPDRLIKPDEHNPDDFLYFHSSGSVLVRNTRPNMTDDDRLRASETIRVFNLDCRQLQGSRRRAIQVYRSGVSAILESIMTWEAELRELYIREEIEKTEWDPYSTVIRHFFEKIA